MKVTEDQITKWMKERIEKRDFTGAAGLSKDFLYEHDISNVFAPQVSKVTAEHVIKVTGIES